jgi:hypothetical protein
MKYNETDLTETARIISYLRSIQIYAVAILLVSVLYVGFKIYSNTKGIELYLLDFFIGVMSLGSLAIFIRLNSKTANIYGVSCIISGLICSFSILYYRGDTDTFITGTGLLAGLFVIRQGVRVAFGNRTREAFSKANQKKIAFVTNILKSLIQSLLDGNDVIHCTYTDDGKKRNLSIKLLDDVACFVLHGHSEPLFFDRNNVYFSELGKKPDFLNVSISVHNHDWLEAQFKPGDFKKYEKWKDL